MIPSCNGCRYLVHTWHALCSVEDAKRVVRNVNPYTGRQEVGYTLRPTVEEMRALGAACGPDAILYAPNWRRRLLAKFRPF